MKLKKGDIIIVLFLVIALGAWTYNNYVANKTPVDNLIIKVNGDVYKKIPVTELKKEQVIHLDFENNRYMDIEANESGVWVKDVVCPDKLCQKTGVINKIGQNITCLPNKVTIYYEGQGGQQNQEIDNVAY